MSDTKVLTPEQIAELRAAIAAHPDHANVPSEECPRCAWQSTLGDVAISLLDAAERCGSLAIELQEVKRVDLEQMEWMSERINELDRRNDEQDRHRRKALADVYTLTADRDDLARRLGEATAALLALRKWIDEYSDLVERSKRWALTDAADEIERGAHAKASK